ncbi:MAG: right-handed parallel beta-helix repeat-containing protein [Lysobacteraceae bacterium]
MDTNTMRHRGAGKRIAMLALLAPLALCGQAVARNWIVGEQAAAGGDGSPGAPFRTIQAAADVAQPGDTIIVQAGTYRETVTPARSGTALQPITIRAASSTDRLGSGAVVVSGADVIGGWKRYAGGDAGGPRYTGGGKIWYAALCGGAGACWTLDADPRTRNQLFYAGTMLHEAQSPDPSADLSRPTRYVICARTECVSQPPAKRTRKGMPAIAADAASDSTTVCSDQLPATPPGDWVGSTLHFAFGDMWMSESRTVTASSGRCVTFAGTHSVGGSVRAGNWFWLSGKADRLDSAGEWFRNPLSDRVYLWAPGGEDPNGARVEMKRRLHAFDLRDRAYIRIVGLEIRAATIITNLPSGTSPGSRRITLSGLTVRYPSHFTRSLPGSGAWSQGASSSGIILAGADHELRDSAIADSAGNGVYLTGSGHVVENNMIANVAYAPCACSGVQIGPTVGATVRHNTIYTSGFRVIDFKGMDGGVIEHNELADGGIQLADLGALYAYRARGNGAVIRRNVIHDMMQTLPGGSDNNNKGIYLDGASSGFQVLDNVMWNVDKGIVLNTDDKGGVLSSSNVIAHNTIVSQRTSIGWNYNPMTGSTIVNNLTTGFVAAGIGAFVSGNRQVPASDAAYFSSPVAGDYRLPTGSPARDAGSVVDGVSRSAISGASPDIGAFEGCRPWTAGANLSPWDPSREPSRCSAETTGQPLRTRCRSLVVNGVMRVMCPAGSAPTHAQPPDERPRVREGARAAGPATGPRDASGRLRLRDPTP